MAKFLYTYTNPTDGDTEVTDEIMAAWGAWFGQLGEAIIDGGNPIATSKTLKADGTVTEVTGAITGYTLVEAADGHAALEMAKGCPVLIAGGTVTVSLTVDM